MNLLKETLKIGKNSVKIITNESDSKKALIYFHGLDGSAIFAKPLFKALPQYKIVAVEQRGHMQSNVKASRFISKHLQDYLGVIKYYFDQGYKVWILGESMGAAYATLLAHQRHSMIKGVFAQSIPNRLVNVFQSSKFDQFKIQSLTFISFLTNLNFLYTTKINYEMFSNNKTLHRLARLADKTKKRQSLETLATWAANKRAWRNLKRKTPQIPLWYFQPTNDIVTNMQKADRVLSKPRDNFEYLKVDGAKHILMYEPQFQQVINKIIAVMG